MLLLIFKFFVLVASADPGTNGNGLGRMILLRHPKSGNSNNNPPIISTYHIFVTHTDYLRLFG
jgi:hypothetical protein